MRTPIVDFVKQYNKRKNSRFHMPGHKGSGATGVEKLDITEIDGADVLYSANGIINESELNATTLFSTARTFYSTEGSTLAIKAMLALVKEKYGNPLILAGRNAHKAFINAIGLLDIDVSWIYPKTVSHLCECKLTVEDLENAIKNAPRSPSAVYITSPDYLGNVSDILGFSTICDRYGIPLLVDNAHGAYLNFLTPSRHPIALGATMCADSAHKTLPALTGGAYLHVSQKADSYFKEFARSALSLFASTSPSYLTLLSLDNLNKYLADGYKDKLSKTVKRVTKLKESLTESGFKPNESEPLKIVVNTSKYGYTGGEISKILVKNKVVAEFYDDDYIVLMASVSNSEKDFSRVERAFSSIKPKTPLISEVGFSVERPIESGLSVRDALLSEKEDVSVDLSVGRILASPTVSCPPAVPIAVCGEVIDERHVKLFKAYGIEKISVVKND